MIRFVAVGALVWAAPALAEKLTEQRIAPSQKKVITNLVSEDGYHIATLTALDGQELWLKDGKKLGGGPKGSIAHRKASDWKTQLAASIGGGGGDQPVASLSPDGSRLAYVRRTYDREGRPRGFEVSVNGAPGKEYEVIGEPLWSPDSRRLAYPVSRAGQWGVVKDGVQGPPLQAAPSHLVFSRNSQRVAYLGKKSDGWQHLFLEHKPLRYWPWEGVTLSPDWTRFAGVLPGPERFVELVDERKFGPHEAPSEPVFSPNGKRFAYVDGKAGSYQVYLDGNPVGPPSRSVPKPLFSPRNRLYWVGRPGEGDYFVYVDGASEGPWEYVVGKPEFAFSPGGRSLYVASRGGKSFLVVDGVQNARSEWGSPVSGSGFVFDDEQDFHYIKSGFRAFTLVCESVGRADPAASLCVRRARALYPEEGTSDLAPMKAVKAKSGP